MEIRPFDFCQMNEKKKNRRSEMKTKGNSGHIKFIKTKKIYGFCK